MVSLRNPGRGEKSIHRIMEMRGGKDFLDPLVHLLGVSVKQFPFRIFSGGS